MTRAVVLDTGVLGLVVHPKQQPEIAPSRPGSRTQLRAKFRSMRGAASR